MTKYTAKATTIAVIAAVFEVSSQKVPMRYGPPVEAMIPPIPTHSSIARNCGGVITAATAAIVMITVEVREIQSARWSVRSPSGSPPFHGTYVFR